MAMQAIQRSRLCGGRALGMTVDRGNAEDELGLASVRRMGFRLQSGSCSPRRCIGCGVLAWARSSASTVAGRLTLNEWFGVWCDG